jgi:hypothetical protein
VQIAEPSPGDYFAPEWAFIFDHANMLQRFRRRNPKATLQLYDFDAEAYPGKGLFEHLGVADAFSAGDFSTAARNARHPDHRVSERLVDSFTRALGGSDAETVLRGEIARRAHLDPASKAAITRLLDGLYAAGSTRLLAAEAGRPAFASAPGLL